MAVYKKLKPRNSGSLACKKKMPENIYTLIFKYFLINYKECGALNFPVPKDSRSEKSEIELSGTGNFVGLNQPFFLLPFYKK